MQLHEKLEAIEAGRRCGQILLVSVAVAHTVYLVRQASL